MENNSIFCSFLRRYVLKICFMNQEDKIMKKWNQSKAQLQQF